eukprot:TRINITY_DN79858_c0_g1_i1.p1 TRINITY_DN79858_c0_g1~~TRINITY_DN79858_c0_g1_i1.p1  ORF type:complete len:253 (-),score=18.94 TRINITY_DN79858_c0_g1_i1:114-872(-)
MLSPQHAKSAPDLSVTSDDLRQTMEGCGIPHSPSRPKGWQKDYDGRWPFPGAGTSPAPNAGPRSKGRQDLFPSPKIKRKPISHQEQERLRIADVEPLVSMVSSAKLPPKEVSPVPPYPFYDVEAAGGSNMSLTNKVDFIPNRNMRATAQRFTDLDPDGVPGPGYYPLKATVGPEAQPLPSPKLRGRIRQDAVFRSEQLRIPEGCNSWIILNGRTAELTADTFRLDDHQWKTKANGQPKGVFFKGSARITRAF